MNVLVFGGSGMLGSDLVKTLSLRGHKSVAPSSSCLDITNPTAVAESSIWSEGFDYCVNCAAYTAVDQAETDVENAAKLNTLAPGFLAKACAQHGIPFIHISTDFVFNGDAREPYKETDATHPLGVYATTKKYGEDRVLAANPEARIVRTAWLFGPNGKCFPRSILAAYQAGKSLRVVGDQVGNPTYVGELARVLVDMMEKSVGPGIYHAAGSDVMSWHDLAVLTLYTYYGRDDIEIESIPTEAWPTPAKRPHYSVLSFEKLASLGIEPMEPTEDSLKDMWARMGE